MDLKTSDKELNDLSRPKPVVLLLLDGWGIAPDSEANIFSLVDTTNFSDLAKNYPVAILNPGNNCLNCRYLSLGGGREIESKDHKREIVTLTSLISANNLKQIKIAETERFTAATYYFNAWQEEKIVGEEQKIISSSIDSPVKEISKEVIRAVKEGEHDFIFASVADIDLVAAKGDTEELKGVIEAVDDSIRKISNEVLAKDGVLIVSAIGGNAEKTKNLATETIDKEMTNNPVPVIIIGKEFKDKNVGLIDPPDNDLSLLSPAGSLADIVPTILQIMQIKKPEEMTGSSLIDQS